MGASTRSLRGFVSPTSPPPFPDDRHDDDHDHLHDAAGVDGGDDGHAHLDDLAGFGGVSVSNIDETPRLSVPLDREV